MDAVHTHFTGIDWAVLIGYLLLTTAIGHALRGKQATMRDFFLGGRSLPWPAVCGSIIATEISALTFVGVPAMVFAAKGNFTYLQWALGSVVARIIVGRFFVPAFYEREIYSPYQFMGERLGSG
jgi:Na+/proline symporter